MLLKSHVAKSIATVAFENIWPGSEIETFLVANVTKIIYSRPEFQGGHQQATNIATANSDVHRKWLK